MKILLIAGVIIAISCFGHGVILAQDSFTDRGIFFLRGSGSFNVSLQEGTPLNLSLGGGYFPFHDILIGVDMEYVRVDDFDDFSAVPFARYYWRQLLFLEAGYYSFKQGDDYFSYLEGGIGYIFLLNDYVTIEPGVYYPFQNDAKPQLKMFISIYL